MEISNTLREENKNKKVVKVLTKRNSWNSKRQYGYRYVTSVF